MTEPTAHDEPGHDAGLEWFRADQELLELFRAGDQEALGDLYLRHNEGAVAYAIRLGADRESAEDLASEAFLNVVDAINRGKGPTVSMGLYLRSAVRNASIRKGKDEKRSIVVDDLEEHLEPTEFVSQPEDGGIVEAFRALPERWQNIIWLREIDQCRTAEAAAALGISPGAATLLYRRARAGLRERYIEVLAASDEFVCAEFRSDIAAYANGTLRGDSKRAYEAHLDGCTSCRRAVKNLSNVVARFAVIIPPTAIGLFAVPRKSATVLDVLRMPGTRLGAGIGLASAAAVAVVLAIAGYGQAEPSTPVLLDRASEHEVQVASVTLPSGECQLLFTGEGASGGAASEAPRAFFEVRNSSAESCKVSFSVAGDELRPLSSVTTREYFFVSRDGNYEVRMVTPTSDRALSLDVR